MPPVAWDWLRDSVGTKILFLWFPPSNSNPARILLRIRESGGMDPSNNTYVIPICTPIMVPIFTPPLLLKHFEGVLTFRCSDHNDYWAFSRKKVPLQNIFDDRQLSCKRCRKVHTRFSSYNNFFDQGQRNKLFLFCMILPLLWRHTTCVACSAMVFYSTSFYPRAVDS